MKDPVLGGGIIGGTPSAKPTEFSFVFSFGDSAVTVVTLPSFRFDVVATINMNRKLRRDELMTGDIEKDFIEMISNGILSYLQGNLSRDLVSVDLNVEDKGESHFSEMVMFFYDLSGSVTFVGGKDELPALPSSSEVLTKVLEILETASFVDVLKSFDKSGLLSIEDVAVSTPNAGATASEIQKADSTGVLADTNKGGSGARAIATPVVIAFVAVFAFTIAVIGFITVRKYRQYQQNEDDGSVGRVKTTTYQNMKEKINNLSPLGRKKLYHHFESPAGSVLFGDIVDNDTEYPIATNVNIEQPPFLTRETQLNNSSYLSNEARNAIDDDSDTTSESGRQNRTLDFLYSDSDSYFGSSIGMSVVSAGVRPRMLSNDYVYSDTDSSLHSGLDCKQVMKNNPHGANVHSIAKINQLVLNNDTASCDGNLEITETEIAAEGEDANHDVKKENQNAGEFSITDNLFARLADLENKIIHTESQFSLEDGVSTKERLEDYKNAYRQADDSCAVQKRSFGAGIFTEETLGMIQRNRLRITPPPSEGDLDGDAIDSLTGSSLLGNVPDDSDADDDEFLFQGSISTVT